MTMPRPLDPDVDRAITDATLALLTDVGFAGMTMERIAGAAGVGKPAIYRRFRDKAELVATVIDGQLNALEPVDLGDTRAELWHAVAHGLPQDGPGYLRLIGGLIAEEERHPELMDAFRRSVLGPRRATVRTLIERGQARGDLRGDIQAEAALDLLAGPLLARGFAGEDTGPRWREEAFAAWWTLVAARRASPAPAGERHTTTTTTPATGRRTT
jgi:AcrR family transcriptional regulator